MYWLDFGPVSGSEPATRHPCVAVQNDGFNRNAIATSVVCLITTSLRRANAPRNVLLKKGEANLPKASVVNVSQIPYCRQGGASGVYRQIERHGDQDGARRTAYDFRLALSGLLRPSSLPQFRPARFASQYIRPP